MKKSKNRFKLNVFDAFSGAGGFSLGFKQAGFNIAGAIEKDKWAAETFQANHPDAKVLIQDISAVSNEVLADFVKDLDIHVLVGGPPCQGFSICNKNAGDPKDPRNSLFHHFIRLAKLLHPPLIIIENVPNLLNARTSGRELVIDIIAEELNKLDYRVYHDVLSATDYGVPQIRKRLFVIASHNRLDKPFPKATHQIQNHSEVLSLFKEKLPPCPSLWDAISDLPDLEAGEGEDELPYTKKAENSYQQLLRTEASKVFNHIAMKHTGRMIERFKSMSWGDSVSDVPDHLKPRQRNSDLIATKVYDQNNRRMHPDKPCHTIPASFYANFVHPFKHRNFTAREGARIQSFPDNFLFKGKPTVVSHKLLEREGRHDEIHLCQYNQIGNAVPPIMARAIANNIKGRF